MCLLTPKEIAEVEQIAHTFLQFVETVGKWLEITSADL